MLGLCLWPRLSFMIFNTPCWGRFNFKRWYIVGEDTSFGVRQKWVWFASYFALPFNSWSFVDLCKLPCFSVSQFPCLQNGEYDSYFSSVQLLSRIWLLATPWSAALQASLSIPTPGVTQTHVHWVSDAMQPSHSLSPPPPPAPNPSQHQGLFQWVNSSHEVAKVLEFQLQHQSFQWTPRTDLL